MNPSDTVPRRLLPFFVLLLSLITALPLAAQATGTVQGRVTDEGGQGVPTAQVFLEGTRLGGVTTATGQFQILNVPVGEYTLVVQRIGFTEGRSERITVTAGQPTEVTIQLERRAVEIAGVVVTGVTEATARANVPFTVSQVTSEQIPIPPSSAVATLQSRVAGARVIGSGQPGAEPNIVLRTPTSLSRSNDPLIVVDGVIITGRTMDISNLDIESLEVVKGAAAASLYGSRAAAGVIQIRTRRGSSIPEGQTQFRWRSEYGTSEIMNPIAFATRHNFRMDEQGNFLGSNGQVVSDRFLAATTRFGFQDQQYPGPVFDHVDALFRPGDTQLHTLSVGSNTAGTSWLATAGFQDDQGPMRENDGYQRTDVRLNVDHRPRDDLSISLSTSIMTSLRDELSGQDGGDFFSFIFTAPDVSLLTPDEDGTPYAFQPDQFGIRTNPLYHNFNNTNEWEANRILAGVDLRYRPVSWLGLDANLSYDRSDRLFRSFVPRGVKTPDRPEGGDGSSRRDSRYTRGINASAGVSTNQQFGDLTVRASVRGLIEDEENHRVDARGQDAAVGGIPDLGTNRSVFILSDESFIRSQGGFLTTDLEYADRYLISALVRRDGSSLFGPEERWHNYYRFSAGWRMANEEWWPLESVDEFRLRYSRGTAGGRPNFSDRFEVFNVSSGGQLSLATLGNPRLKPEQTLEQEFGLDMVLFRRFSLEMNYARQTTTDQLLNIPLPAMFGFNSQWQNAGTIEGSSFELEARFQAVETNNFAWSVGLVADRSRAKITEFNAPCFTDEFQFRCAGEEIGTMRIPMWAKNFDHIANQVSGSARGAFDVNDDGLLVAVGEGNSWRDGVAKELWGTQVQVDGRTYDWGMPIMRVDDDGLRNTHVVGNGNADLNLGISNTVRWGNFSLYGLVDTQIGGQVYNATLQRMNQWGRSALQDQHTKAEAEKKPLNYYVAALYDVNRFNSWWVEDADHIRLREVSLSYRLDPSRFGFLARTGMDAMSLSVVGRNLWLWTDYTGYDPAVGTPLERFDDFNFPSYRTFTFSLDIQF
jgi:TonB-linked SusC/RagA family outer membrane protein